MQLPVGVEAGDGGLAVAVQVLRLLQQHVVEDPRDVDGDVVLYGLQHRHVGANAGQQLAGLGDLLGGLVVHGHAHYRPGGRGREGDHSELEKLKTCLNALRLSPCPHLKPTKKTLILFFLVNSLF